MAHNFHFSLSNLAMSFSVFFTVPYKNMVTKIISHHKQISCIREPKVSFGFYQLEILKCPTAGYIQQTAQLLTPVCSSSCLNCGLIISVSIVDSSTLLPFQ